MGPQSTVQYTTVRWASQGRYNELLYSSYPVQRASEQYQWTMSTGDVQLPSALATPQVWLLSEGAHST